LPLGAAALSTQPQLAWTVEQSTGMRDLEQA
jgi:hypothetical protein